MANYSITPYYSGRGYYDVTGADGNKYIYVPKEFVEKGFVSGGTQWVNDNFLNQDLLSKSSAFKLDNADAITGAAKSLYSDPTNGYVWKYSDLYPYTNDFSFGGYGISADFPAIQGLGSANGRPVYVTSAASGQDQTVYTGGGNFDNTRIERTGGGGLFGGFLGQVFNPILSGISGIVGGVSGAVAGLGQGVSDAIHGVGTTVAKSPLLNTAAVIALTPYVGPVGAAALVSANAGASPENIVKNMILAGVSVGVAQQVAPGISEMVGGGNAGAIAGQAASSATTAALTGRDPIQAALNATISGGVSVGTGEILKDVEGFQDLTPAQQKAVATVVSAELQGKDPTAALISQALEVGRQTVRDTLNTKIDEADFGTNQGAVNKVAEMEAKEKEAEAQRQEQAKQEALAEEARQQAAALEAQRQTEAEAARQEALAEEAKRSQELQAQQEADAAKAAEEKRLAEEENIKKIEAARTEQPDTKTSTEPPPAVDESYLSNLSPADLERYKAMQAGLDTVPEPKPQDLGVTQENIDSYEKTQQENAAAGGWPAGYKANEDGTATMVHDDGSTVTIDDKNNIVYTTEAPAGNLISDPATQTPQTGGSTVKAPSGTTKATDQLFSSMPTAQKSVVMDMASSGTPLAQAVTAASAFTPVGIKTTGDVGASKFEGPLDTFLKMVKESDYAKKPTEAQNQKEPAVQQDLLSQPSNYFSYGQPTEIDQLISGEAPNFTAKAGGLAVPMMAAGGNTRYGKYAGGGLNVVNHSGKARLDFRKGDAVTGPGDGQSDDIPAMLADGEFVFPADVVAALGNGSTKAGSDKLYDMMHSIREYHRAAKPKDLPPPAKKSPLDYLKSSKARR